MINLLYNMTSKGLLKALSFLLASGLFAMILLKSTAFGIYFGGKIPYFALAAFYGMGILCIHGIGFEIRSRCWRFVFLPLIGYSIVIPSICVLFFN